MDGSRSVSLVALAVGAVILAGCIPTSWSAERQAAAVDACQRARSIAAPIPNPAAGTPVSSRDRDNDYIMDALDYLLQAEAGRTRRRPPRRPISSFSQTHRDWILPTEAVLIERQDAIRVAVIRSGNRGLVAAHASSVVDLLEECRRRNLIP